VSLVPSGGGGSSWHGQMTRKMLNVLRVFVARWTESLQCATRGQLLLDSHTGQRNTLDNSEC